MSLQNPSNNKHFVALLYACISTIIALIISLLIGATFGTTYRERSTIYLILLGWSICGAFVIYQCTQKETGTISIRKILLWVFALWIWPIFFIQLLRRKNSS